MLTKEKVLKLCVPFVTKEHEDGEDDDDELIITGLASTNDEDRSGDIIASNAWKKKEALANYLKNPIVLAFHDMSRPIGKTIKHEVVSNGLSITAKISKSAGDIIGLIKEGILSAFSVGFVIKDADFDPDSGIFMIKELELFEVSVVSIPANQNALFSIEKNFSNPEDYKEFRNQFIKSEETLMVDKKDETAAVKPAPIDIAALAREISSIVKGDLKAEEKAAKEAEKAAADEVARMEATATTAAERLVKDLRAELEVNNKSISDALVGLRETLKKESENGELEKVFAAEKKDSKMQYAGTEKKTLEMIDQNTRDGMFYASKIFGCPITETKTFKEYVKKSNMEHWDSGVTGQWEDEYSTRVQNALRQQLVVEPLFPAIPMTTPTLNMPINPEAGDATWVHSTAYRSITAPYDETNSPLASSGAAKTHQIDEQVLIAYKLATREYIGYEEEEDSIVALAAIINDAVVRRMARSSDLSFLRGGGVLTSASFDPILGLEGRGANTTDVTIAGGAAWEANLTEDVVATMRRNLVLYGIDSSALVLLVSHDLYYGLMTLPKFKTVNEYGPQATVHTGEVGNIFGVKVVVSQMFDNAAITTGTVGTTLGIMCRPTNFIRGELRGIMTEGDRDIINQKRVIVSSRRFAFNDIITGEGTVNLQIAS